MSETKIPLDEEELAEQTAIGAGDGEKAPVDNEAEVPLEDLGEGGPPVQDDEELLGQEQLDQFEVTATGSEFIMAGVDSALEVEAQANQSDTGVEPEKLATEGAGIVEAADIEEGPVGYEIEMEAEEPEASERVSYEDLGQRTEVYEEDKYKYSDQVGGEEASLYEDTDKEEISPNVHNFEATATVKFVLMPVGTVITLALTLGQTLPQLKTYFSTELKIPMESVVIMFEGKSLSDSQTIADLGVGPNGTIQLELQSADPVSYPIKAYRPRHEYHMPDVITVRVVTDEGATKDVVVEIERTTEKKKFVGGYRHKKTGIEYHNAAAQTSRRPPPSYGLGTRFCRDTQTEVQRHMRQQTTNDMATQMTKIGVYVSNMQDKLIIPGKYFTSEENARRILKSVLVIQTHYRRWMAVQYVNRLRRQKGIRIDWERKEEIRKRQEKEDRIKQDFQRRMGPKKKEDFDLLYAALEKWRLEELERINRTLTGAERKAALCMLLDQETQLLSAIDRHKVDAAGEIKQRYILSFLEKAAAPKKWRGFDGNFTFMDTPYTIRARELRDIYNSINMKYLTQDERLDVLLTLKHTVKEHDCKLTQEIVELIDREADLLMRGIRECNLEGLRKRISTLFLQYIKTPIFNPEATRLIKVPQDPAVLRRNINFCSGCSRYLKSTEFPLSSNSSVVGKCRQCVKTENEGRERQDFSKIRYMLKTLRRQEEVYEDGSQIAFLLQERDLRYLLENIWNSQSILSAWEELYDLQFVRWDKHQEWAPWNCILLTKDEAEAHNKLDTLEQGYGSVFIQNVMKKHTVARNYFSRMPGMAELIRQKAEQRNITTNGPSVLGRAVPVQP